MTGFSVLMSLLGIVPGNSWLGGVSLKDYKIKWKIKIREMKTKHYLDTLIILRIKWDGMVEIKRRLYRYRFNYALSKLIADNGREDLWKREYPDSSEFNL